MKKILLLLLLIAGFSNAQTVNIPDANFKAKLLSANAINGIALNANNQSIVIDINGNNEIEVSEALDVASLYVSNSNISDLAGVQGFSNLKLLNCSGNYITTPLDLTSMTQLEALNIVSNNGVIPLLDLSGLSSFAFLSADNATVTTLNASGTNLINLYSLNVTNLNVSNCTSLIYIMALTDELQSINVAGCTMLSSLQVYSNYNLTSLDVSGLTNLTELICMSNNLSYLNLTGTTNLEYIDCKHNLLTNLDVSTSPAITHLDCSANLFTTLDFSNLSQLNQLNIDYNPNLESLYIKNGANETFTPYSFSSSNLIFICADEDQVAFLQTEFEYSMPNTIVTSYCSFAPGGSYNSISGHLTFDANSDGCDVSDLPKSNIRLSLLEGTNLMKQTFSNFYGNYIFYSQIGNFTVTPQIENASWFTFSPSSATIPFSTLGNTTTQNFCLAPVGVHNDIEIVIAPINAARPGFDATYQIVYRNKGNQLVSGTIYFSYEEDVLDFVSSSQTLASQSSGNLSWNYSNLMPFESRSFIVTLNVNSPTEIPAVNIGDLLDFSAVITSITPDEFTGDNSFVLNQTVVGSYDPNDKVCLEGTIVPVSKIGDYLHYTINFENTGTAAATFVVVKDIIDVTKFDINSLQIMNSSHLMTTRITGNQVEFIFENINLESNEHGNVTFKIKTKNTLVEGNTVTNKANIYFDYNAPVITNTTSTTFQILSNGDFELDNSIAIAPNPAKNNVNINCNNNVKTIELFDVQGRVLITQIVNNSQTQLDVSNYTNGIYFVKITTEKGVKIEKIIKE